MKARHCVAALMGAAFALAPFAGDVQATDDATAYRFRLISNIDHPVYIRCGSSGNWTAVAAWWREDVSCSEPSAQTKVVEGIAHDWTHRCPSSQPVMIIWYYSDGIGPIQRSDVSAVCHSA